MKSHSPICPDQAPNSRSCGLPTSSCHFSGHRHIPVTREPISNFCLSPKCSLMNPAVLGGNVDVGRQENQGPTESPALPAQTWDPPPHSASVCIKLLAIHHTPSDGLLMLVQGASPGGRRSPGWHVCLMASGWEILISWHHLLPRTKCWIWSSPTEGPS